MSEDNLYHNQSGVNTLTVTAPCTMFRHYPLPAAGMPLLGRMLSSPAAGVGADFSLQLRFNRPDLPMAGQAVSWGLAGSDKGDDGAWEFLQDDWESFISKRPGTNLAGPSLVPPSSHEKTSHVPRDIPCPQTIISRSLHIRIADFEFSISQKNHEACSRKERHSKLQVFRHPSGWMKNKLSQCMGVQSTAKFFDWIWLWTKVHDRGQRFPFSILK